MQMQTSLLKTLCDCRFIPHLWPQPSQYIYLLYSVYIYILYKNVYNAITLCLHHYLSGFDHQFVNFKGPKLKGFSIIECIIKIKSPVSPAQFLQSECFLLHLLWHLMGIYDGINIYIYWKVFENSNYKVDGSQLYIQILFVVVLQ